jgi:hypothetical protein
MEKTKVSAKQIAPYIQALTVVASNLRTEVENMPACTKKTSLLVTLAALDKKLIVKARAVAIDEGMVTDYLEKHPEILEKLREEKQEKKKKRF